MPTVYNYYLYRKYSLCFFFFEVQGDVFGCPHAQIVARFHITHCVTAHCTTDDLAEISMGEGVSGGNQLVAASGTPAVFTLHLKAHHIFCT